MQAALSRVCCASGMSLQRCPFQPEAAVITGRSCACSAFVTQPCSEARLAQPVERKALNLVVVGSSPTVGVAMERCSWQHREQTCQFLRRLLFVSGNQPCPFGGPMDRQGRGCFTESLLAAPLAWRCPTILRRPWSHAGSSAPCLLCWRHGSAEMPFPYGGRGYHMGRLRMFAFCHDCPV